MFSTTPRYHILSYQQHTTNLIILLANVELLCVKQVKYGRDTRVLHGSKHNAIILSAESGSLVHVRKFPLIDIT